MVGSQGFTWLVPQSSCDEARINELLSSAFDCHFAEVVGGEVVEEVQVLMIYSVIFLICSFQLLHQLQNLIYGFVIVLATVKLGVWVGEMAV